MPGPAPPNARRRFVTRGDRPVASGAVGLPAVSPTAYRKVTFGAAVALAFIIVSGGAVRLTGSGLGCPDWPTCAEGRVVAPMEFHALVEFVNRMVTGLVSLAVIVAVLGSLLRTPRRPDLVKLSLGLVAGVLAQIVLGGLTVLFELAPPFVMGHFLLSMVILADAVVLHHRAGRPDGPVEPVVGPDLTRLGRLVVGAAAVVVLTGTVVTAAGPHGGDEEAPRLDLMLPDVARVHGASVALLLAMVVTLVVLARRAQAPPTVRRAGLALLGLLVAQAGIGYVQWFTGVPALLVGAHIAGAAAVWTAAVRLVLTMSAPAPAAAVPAPASPSVVALSGR